MKKPDRAAERARPARRRTRSMEVLAFGAHPDDAELGCGGLLAKMAERGYRTGLVDLTRGELATSGDVATRAREAEEAAQLLGVAERRNLALPDGGLRHGEEEQLASVVRAIRELRPFLVLAPFPRCSHPDHVEAGLLVARAAHFAGIRRWGPSLAAARPGAILWYESRIALEPTLLVDVSAEWERKRGAVAAHRSQFHRGGRSVETVLNDPAFLGAFETRARGLGSLIGVAMAEPYVSRGPLPIDDPVLVFRSAPGPVGRVWGV